MKSVTWGPRISPIVIWHILLSSIDVHILEMILFANSVLNARHRYIVRNDSVRTCCSINTFRFFLCLSWVIRIWTAMSCFQALHWVRLIDQPYHTIPYHTISSISTVSCKICATRNVIPYRNTSQPLRRYAGFSLSQWFFPYSIILLQLKSKSVNKRSATQKGILGLQEQTRLGIPPN